MRMLYLNETVDLLASNIHCYSHVLRREDGNVLRALEFEGQRKKLM